MIRYRPVRHTLTASLKDEQVYNTLEDLRRDVFDRWQRIYTYIGSDLHPEQFVIGDPQGDDLQIGWHNVRPVYVRRRTVGYCEGVDEV